MTADNKSMIVAAFALPIPKLIMVFHIVVRNVDKPFAKNRKRINNEKRRRRIGRFQNFVFKGIIGQTKPHSLRKIRKSAVFAQPYAKKAERKKLVRNQKKVGNSHGEQQSGCKTEL